MGTIPKETPMKALNHIAAAFLSLVLGLAPFAVIAVDDSAAAKAEATQGMR
jgi:hypothetical protein